MAIFITALAVLLLVSLAIAHQRGHKKAGRLQPIPVKVERPAKTRKRLR